jgi:hypothetical protein
MSVPALAPVAPADPLDAVEREALLAEVEATVRAVVAGLEPDPAEARRPGPGRPRVLPALALWSGVLVCVLRGLGSQRAVWRLLSAQRLWDYPRFPVSDQAVYKRLAEDGTGPLEALFAAVGRLLGDRLAPWRAADLAPFATEVVAIDETTLDQVARALPALRGVPKGDDRLLPGKLAAVFDLRTQLFRRVEHVAEPRQNEKVAARGLLDGLAKGALVLADLGYFGFRWFDDLTDGGYWWVSRLRQKTSYEVVHAFYARGETFDGLVWLGARRADRAKHAVRLVQFRHGGTLFRYVTNVRDPAVLPPKEVARLYARRWDVELAFKLVKRHLGLHLLWSAKPGVVRQQVWAVLTIAQVVQALRLEIAGRAGVDPFDVSLPLLVEYLPLLLARGEDPVALFVAEGRRLQFIRPSPRTAIRAPEIPRAEVIPRPPDLVLAREPRYAERRCGPRAAHPPPGGNSWS